MMNFTLALISFALLTGCSESGFMGGNQQIKDDQYRLGDDDAGDAGDEDSDTNGGKGGVDGDDDDGRNGGSDSDSDASNDGGLGGSDDQGGYDSDSDVGEDGLSLTKGDFSFNNFCSTHAIEKSGAQVVTATSGITAQLIDSASFEVKHTFSKDKVAKKIRDELMNRKGFSVVLKDDNGKSPKAGTYYLALCDKSESSCTLTKSFKELADRDDEDKNEWEDNAPRGLVGFIAGSGISINDDHEVTSYDQNSAWALYDGEDGDEWHDCNVVNSPLMVDLAGHNLEFSKITAGAMFDINADGKQDLISWPVRASTVFLALDGNRDGKIDSGAELFGNHMKGPDGKKSANGFDALAKHDDNGDGKINGSDHIFSRLVFWSDANRNGAADAGELVPVSQAGLKEVSLAYDDLHKTGKIELDQWKNQFRQRSTVVMTDGKELPITDVWFRQIPGLKNLTATR